MSGCWQRGQVSGNGLRSDFRVGILRTEGFQYVVDQEFSLLMRGITFWNQNARRVPRTVGRQRRQ